MARNNQKSTQPTEVATETTEAAVQPLTARERWEQRNQKISQSQTGVPKRSVRVKVGDVEYGTLCDALRAHGFNVQGDWIRSRKLLKEYGVATMLDADKKEITFVTVQ